MPVSTIRSGWSDQISSCIATMSCGYWMIGRPSQEKLYEYLAAIEVAMNCARRGLQRRVAAIGRDPRGDLALEFVHVSFPWSISRQWYRCAVAASISRR